MKKIFLALMAVAAIAMTGCKEQPQPVDPNPQPETENGEFKIEKLRAIGKPIPNPTITLTNCKPEGSDTTLKSIRYVEYKPIYYMDYMAQVDWESLLTQPADEHIEVFDVTKITNKVSQALFNNPAIQTENPEMGGSCSGFICHNSRGELLHGRNFDGDYGEMVVVFNKNVKPGEHKSVMMTDLNMVQKTSGEMLYGGDSALLKPGKELNVLLRQPMIALDGMNDAGLVISCYQLPDFQKQDSSLLDPYPYKSPTPRPYGTDQSTNKIQSNMMAVMYLALTKCTTVDEVVDLFRSYDYVALNRTANLHWCVSDTKDFLHMEYWPGDDYNAEGENPKGTVDVLFTYNADQRSKSAFLGNHNIAYEFMSMENYYYHPVPSSTFYTDYWQREFGGVFRAHNMMSHYSLVMEEETALRVLQTGSYGLEVPGHTTNWSCIYNSARRTILFTVRNQTDRAFSIDLKTDL